MTPVTRFDAWLIAGPHQSVVDLTQRKPAWLAQQCLIAGVVTNVVHAALFPPSLPWLAFLLVAVVIVVSAGLWLFTMAPPLFAFMGEQRWMRLAMLFICGLHVPVCSARRLSAACLQ